MSFMKYYVQFINNQSGLTITFLKERTFLSRTVFEELCSFNNFNVTKKIHAYERKKC